MKNLRVVSAVRAAVSTAMLRWWTIATWIGAPVGSFDGHGETFLRTRDSRVLRCVTGTYLDDVVFERNAENNCAVAYLIE